MSEVGEVPEEFSQAAQKVELVGFEAAKPQTPAQKLSQEIKSLGGLGRVVENNISVEYNPFPEIVINNEKTNQSEPFVRVYRGITRPEGEVVYNQASYALRARNEVGDVMVVEEAKPLVKALADNPTYANLQAYFDFMTDKVDEKTLRDLTVELLQIEDGVLDGFSVRQELLHHQILFNGGYADNGIAPYVAASWSPEQALGYTRSQGALLVIDLPISELEIRRAGEDREASIKNWIDPQRITAIIPYNSVPSDGKDKGQLTQTLETLNQYVKMNLLTPEQRAQKITEIADQNKSQDAQLHQEDVNLIQARRVEELRRLLPDMNLDSLTLEQEAKLIGTDIYTLAKQKILDQIDSQMAEIDYPDYISNMKRYDRADYQGKDGIRHLIKWDKLNNEMILGIKQYSDRLLARYRDIHSQDDNAPSAA